MNKRQWARWVGVVAITLPMLAACDRQQQAQVPPGKGGPGGAGGQPQMPPPEVATITVQTQRQVLTRELHGRTTGYLVSEIRPQVSGLIQKRHFEEGTDVQAGDLLYQIDPTPFEIALSNAEANVVVAEQSANRAKAALLVTEAGVKRQQATLELAKTNRQRMEELFKEKAVAAAQRDQAVTDADIAEANLRTAEAQIATDQAAIGVAEAAVLQAREAVKAAKVNLGYTKITAPIAGRIGQSSVTDGALVAAYQPAALATIQQFHPIYVDVPHATVEQLRLKRKLQEATLSQDGGEQQVELILEDGSIYPIKGKLQSREIAVNPSAFTVTLRIVVDNPDGLLLPGMFVKATIQEGVKENAILIPQPAVSRTSRGEPLAMVVENGVAVLRKLVLDRAIGGNWLVVEGIAAGDHLIVEGLQNRQLRPGVAVKEVAPGTKPSAPGSAAGQPPASNNPKSN